MEPGKSIDLGKLEWTPVRYGKQIWEIGTPDRTGKEFKHGDDYWHWGLYNQYPKDFPNDVNFVIGKSDPRTDWNYANARAPIGRMERLGRSRSKCPMRRKGKAILRAALAGVARSADRRRRQRQTRRHDRAVDGQRDDPARWDSRVLDGEGSDIRRIADARGNEHAQADDPAGNAMNGIIYDYLRLEMDENGWQHQVDECQRHVRQGREQGRGNHSCHLIS